MKIIKVVILIVSVLVISLSAKVYSMVKITKISFDTLDQSPEVLKNNKILYFDNFNDPRLEKYRDFLKTQGILNIKDTNNKVLAVVDLVNRIHNSNPKESIKEYPDFMIIPGNNSYCQRSSKLLSILLSSMSIYSRHWHSAYQNYVGYHQFIEYYNETKKKWIIIGPYYGVQFESDGNLLSAKDMILKGGDTDKYGKFLNIARFDRNQGELKSAWSNKLILAKVNDYLNYDNPEIKYGFWGKITILNRLPENKKKIFRVFGRNNAPYEAFNFKKSNSPEEKINE